MRGRMPRESVTGSALAWVTATTWIAEFRVRWPDRDSRWRLLVGAGALDGRQPRQPTQNAMNAALTITAWVNNVQSLMMCAPADTHRFLVRM